MNEQESLTWSWRRIARDAVVFAIALVMCWFIILSFIVEPVTGVGRSMWPTLSSESQLMIGKSDFGFRLPWNPRISWGGRLPHRSEIVMAEIPVELFPEDAWMVEEGQRYASVVKRVIGLPGDVVTQMGTQLFVNGVLVSPPQNAYGREAVQSQWTTGRSAYTQSGERPLEGEIRFWEIPAGFVFLAGDNRLESYDSRNFGLVPANQLIGPVWWVHEQEEGWVSANFEKSSP